MEVEELDRVLSDTMLELEKTNERLRAVEGGQMQIYTALADLKGVVDVLVKESLNFEHRLNAIVEKQRLFGNDKN